MVPGLQPHQGRLAQHTMLKYDPLLNCCSVWESSTPYETSPEFLSSVNTSFIPPVSPEDCLSLMHDCFKMHAYTSIYASDDQRELWRGTWNTGCSTWCWGAMIHDFSMHMQMQMEKETLWWWLTFQSKQHQLHAEKHTAACCMVLPDQWTSSVHGELLSIYIADYMFIANILYYFIPFTITLTWIVWCVLFCLLYDVM